MKGQGGQVGSWITSWWKDKTEAAWLGHPMKKLAPADWFELHAQDMNRIWTPPTQQQWKLWFKYSMKIAWHTPIPPTCFLYPVWWHIYGESNYPRTRIVFHRQCGAVILALIYARTSHCVTCFASGSCYKLQRSLGATGDSSTPWSIEPTGGRIQISRDLWM